jgi:hypothetical protein
VGKVDSKTQAMKTDSNIVLPGQDYQYRQQPDTRHVARTLNYKFCNMKINRKINNDDDDHSRIKKAN